MREVVVVDAVRTPTGVRKGALSVLRPDDTLGMLLFHLASERVGLDLSLVEDFICGCATQIGEQGLNIARNALLAGGFPVSIPGVAVNRQEGSSQQAIAFAAQAISSGEMDTALAGGVEFMSRQPAGSDGFGDHISHLGEGVSPRLFERFDTLESPGISAEMMAEKWSMSREELDEYALRSNRLAASAIEDGLYEKEVMPLEITTPEREAVILKMDQGPRADIGREDLGSLKPAFRKDGVVTTGNSGQVSDGAAAILLMSAKRCSQLGLRPRARYICTAVSGVDPSSMLTGPIDSTRAVLAKAGLDPGDIDVFEINETFATTPLAWMREMRTVDPGRVNAWGGAIANGNPIGASGAKLACTLISELEYLGGRYGLQATAAEMGMGIATIYERID
ncbi:MAG: thiolase family protein [Actinomycetota bacterium]|nr:thiolase family protein [Actinomycetota bacterium]